MVRRRACDVVGRSSSGGTTSDRTSSGQATFGGLAGDLVRALSDEAPPVVEAACYALGELGGAGLAAEEVVTGVVMALAATARSHSEPLCREAAVAALGAIGRVEGLPSVIGAMEDKPAVRRRAAVALAAFEGREAEMALERAAHDRDWQVRQVAEDLIGDRETPD